MPPRPKYSRGCHACRRMKVKCDEQKPQCRRCIKGGRKCPGFPEISNFLSMNGDFPNQTIPSTSQRHSTSIPSASHSEIYLNIQPPTDWIQHAIVYFFRNFVYTAKADGLGYLQFLPDLISDQPNYACFRDSLHAVAMTSLANISSTRSLQLRAEQLYCGALRSMSMALQRSSGDDDAALLASIFLLQKREALSSNSNAIEPHETGLVQLLRARAPRKPRNAAEVGLLWTIHARLQVRSMDGGWCCADGLDTLELPNGLKRPRDSDLGPLYGNVSKVRQEMEQIAMSKQGEVFAPSCVSRLDRVLNLGFRTERELSAWALNIPKTELPSEIEFPGFEETSPDLKFVANAYTFGELQDGCRWCVYWSSRIQLLRTLLDGLNLASQMGMEYISPLSREAMNLDMKSAADSICSSVPFMVGEIDSQGNPSVGQRGQALGAYFMTRFLYTVNEIPVISRQQRLWTLDCLLKFGQVWGIGAALRARALLIQRHGLEDSMNLHMPQLRYS